MNWAIAYPWSGPRASVFRISMSSVPGRNTGSLASPISQLGEIVLLDGRFVKKVLKGSRRHEPGRPGPLEVEAADAAVHVEDFAHEEQARAPARRHRCGIDFVERHAAGSGLSEVIAARRNDRDWPLDKRVGHAAAVVASKLSGAL